MGPFTVSRRDFSKKLDNELDLAIGKVRPGTFRAGGLRGGRLKTDFKSSSLRRFFSSCRSPPPFHPGAYLASTWPVACGPLHSRPLYAPGEAGTCREAQLRRASRSAFSWARPSSGARHKPFISASHFSGTCCFPEGFPLFVWQS